MKIVLHGASDFGSSNFGDFLYAEEIFCHIVECYKGCCVRLHKPSDFFRKYIMGYRDENFSLKEADLAIYIPGGYFGEGHNARIRDNIFQFIRFMPFGLAASVLRKRMIVVGVGAGPLDSSLMKLSVKRIVNSSMFVSVRDDESASVLEHLGCDRPIEAGDMILAMDLASKCEETEQIRRVREYAGQKKILFVHFNHSDLAAHLFAASVDEWRQNHPEYCIIVGADQILANEDELFGCFARQCPDCFHFVYGNPYELLSLLRMSDTILTCKLHVGVVGSMFGKSVLCFAEHPEKSVRFYRQIGEEGRFYDLYNADNEKVTLALDKFHERTINIPYKAIEKAREHWRIIDRSISICKGDLH